MSSFLVHLLIPPLAIMQLRFLPAKWIWGWVWVSIAPDVDYVGWIFYVNEWFPVNLHRALLHNVFITITLFAAFVAGLRDYALRNGFGLREGVVDYLRTRRGAGWFLAAYFHFTHLLLDCFRGGVVPFFPLSNTNFYSFFQIVVNTQTQRPQVDAGTGVYEGAPDVSSMYLWLDGEQFAFLLLTSLTLGLAAWLQRRPREAEPAPPGPTRAARAR